MRTRFFPLTLVSLLVVTGIVLALTVPGRGDEPLPGLKAIDTREPPAKQTVEAEEVIRQATAEAGPHAPKPDFGRIHTLPTPQSCPIDPSAYRTQILAHPAHQLPVDETKVVLVNEAVGLTAEGAPYSLWSGHLRSDANQGVIGVWLGARDPCAEGRTGYAPQEYLTPFKGGAVRLTSIVGDTVEFQTADGTAGRFDFVTGVFE